MSKSEIRKIYQQKRFELSESQVKSASQTIAKNFINNLLPKIKNFSEQKLAFYVATNNEVDPIFIIEHCQKLTNIITLPKISPSSLNLDFKAYQLNDKLIKNNSYPKILEPNQTALSIIPDVIFVPLIAFDKNCHRIGMGKGFYDATINNFHNKNHYPTLIGLAFDWQECPPILALSSDQKLDFIISENRIISSNQ
jgi:5-formyltetrahydrofolate cyclo-ligase